MAGQQDQGLHTTGRISKATVRDNDSKVVSERSVVEYAQETLRQEPTFGIGAGSQDPTAKVSKYGTGQ